MNNNIQKIPAGGGQSELNVLYCCSEEYAPFAGVSITSLFMNNTEIENLTVFIVTENVRKMNKQRFLKLSEQYKRNIILIDAKRVKEKIKESGVMPYRGSFATYYKLFFQEYIEPRIDRLLYIDCDTIVQGSLKYLDDFDMSENCIGMVRCSLNNKNGRRVTDCGLREYNAGIILFNVNVWKTGKWMYKIISHVKNERAKYVDADQGVLNAVCAGHILKLPQEYNFPPIHRAYSDDVYFKAMKNTLITREEIEYAREHPVIYHTYRFLGQFPWHRDTLHPDRELFNQYLEKSLWNDYEKKPSPSNLVFRIERALCKILPKGMFFRLFLVASEIAYCRQNNRLVKEEAESRALK